MKKYFMHGTDNEVQFGDEINVDLSKEMEDGSVKHQHIEAIFHPSLVDMFIKKEIIEERECEEEEEENTSTLDFMVEESLEDKSTDDMFCYLIKRIHRLEERFKELDEVVANSL